MVRVGSAQRVFDITVYFVDSYSSHHELIYHSSYRQSSWEKLSTCWSTCWLDHVDWTRSSSVSPWLCGLTFRDDPRPVACLHSGSDSPNYWGFEASEDHFRWLFARDFQWLELNRTHHSGSWLDSWSHVHGKFWMKRPRSAVRIVLIPLLGREKGSNPVLRLEGWTVRMPTGLLVLLKEGFASMRREMSGVTCQLSHRLLYFFFYVYHLLLIFWLMSPSSSRFCVRIILSVPMGPIPRARFVSQIIHRHDSPGPKSWKVVRWEVVLSKSRDEGRVLVQSFGMLS